MATTTTYAVALTTIRDFAKANGFDNEEVIEKIDKLIAQKTKTRANTGKSEARKANERMAHDIVNVMEFGNIEVIDNKWVRDNIDGVNSPARATAVLNVATDMGLLKRNVIAKSASRNTFEFIRA